MSWNETEILAVRREIFDAAKAMLAGSLSYIEGARIIAKTWRAAKLDEDDDDFLPFVGIDSETEALPLGKIRELWNVAALETLQPDIDRSEAWAKGYGEPYCQNLVDRFSRNNWTIAGNRTI